MGVLDISKMLVLSSILSATIISCQAVSPLTPEELKQIRDFTADAHMKRLQNFPDQLMTPSTHYLGRRIPANNDKKQPTIFMQAPNNNNGGATVKQTSFQIEPQPAGAVQNYLINYPITTNHVQSGPIFHKRPQGSQLQYLPVQNVPQRGPPPPHYKRPSFFSFGGPESSPPQSLLQFFFPKRPARRPPSFRPPIRFEYAQTAHNPIIHHHNQNLQAIMAQQHLLAVQQQAGQQSVVQPSSAPVTSQSTTVKNTLSAQSGPTVLTPSAADSNPTNAASGNTNSSPLLIQNQQNFLRPQSNPPLFNLNQFHREVPFFGKPLGKPGHPQKFGPVSQGYVPQNRPGDDVNYIQKYTSPQSDFSFLPLGPPVISGPNSNRFSSPVSFTHIEQMPFPLQHQQHLPVVVQSQEFPHYHFTTTFTASNPDGPPPPSTATSTSNTFFIDNTNEQVRGAPVRSTEIGQGQGPTVSIPTTTIRHTHRVKKIRPRPASTTPTTTTTIAPAPAPTTSQSLGDIIFESAKETREFHDIAHLAAPTISNLDGVVVKPRKPKQHKSHHHHHHQQQQQQILQQHAPVESHRKATAESGVVLAPLVFTGESNEPLPPTSSPRPITSTLVSISTISTTTQEPYKPKVVKSKGVAEYHSQKPKNANNHHGKRVTASGAGLGAATMEPLRLTSTGSSATTSSSSSSSSRSTITPGGRVVTTSVTSRVVSTGPQNSQKRYRLRKVKVPNPDAIKTNNKSSTTSSLPVYSAASSSSTTKTISNTTPLTTHTPRSTTTISSTESSLTTTV